MSLRDKIFAAAKPATIPLEVPEWGVTVYLKRLSLGGSMAYLDAKDGQGRALALLTHGLCDAEGKPVFTEADAASMLEMQSAPCSRVLEQIYKLKDQGGLAAAGEESGATAASATSTP